jgi:hypothetical protein
VVFLAVVAAAVLPGTAHARIYAFKSPSGNVACVISTDRENGLFAQCELKSKGVGYSVRRRGRVTTYDGRGYDDLAGQRFVLRYGRSIRRGDFRCTSRMSGMTCRSLVSGHGFTLSRERQRRF